MNTAGLDTVPFESQMMQCCLAKHMVRQPKFLPSYLLFNTMRISYEERKIVVLVAEYCVGGCLVMKMLIMPVVANITIHISTVCDRFENSTAISFRNGVVAAVACC